MTTQNHAAMDDVAAYSELKPFKRSDCSGNFNQGDNCDCVLTAEMLRETHQGDDQSDSVPWRDLLFLFWSAAWRIAAVCGALFLLVQIGALLLKLWARNSA